MWSHYADHHRGICLEFGTDTSPLKPINPLVGARKVDYLPDYPKWVPHTIGDLDVHVLLTKSIDWKYEQEYRVLAFAEGMSRPRSSDFLIAVGGFLTLPKGVIKAVIAGCEADAFAHPAWPTLAHLIWPTRILLFCPD